MIYTKSLARWEIEVKLCRKLAMPLLTTKECEREWERNSADYYQFVGRVDCIELNCSNCAGLIWSWFSAEPQISSRSNLHIIVCDFLLKEGRGRGESSDAKENDDNENAKVDTYENHAKLTKKKLFPSSSFIARVKFFNFHRQCDMRRLFTRKEKTLPLKALCCVCFFFFSSFRFFISLPSVFFPCARSAADFWRFEPLRALPSLVMCCV